jgi:hypothetical protein
VEQADDFEVGCDEEEGGDHGEEEGDEELFVLIFGLSKVVWGWGLVWDRCLG